MQQHFTESPFNLLGFDSLVDLQVAVFLQQLQVVAIVAQTVALDPARQAQAQ